MKLFLLSLIVFFTGCSSIPISTMLKMASFDKNDFEKLEPEELTVKVLTSGSTAMRSKSAVIKGSIESKSKVLPYKFDLKNIRAEQVVTKGGIFSSDKKGIAVYYKLTDKGVDDFRRFQGESRLMLNPSFSYDISTIFKMDDNFDYTNSDVYMTISTKMSKDESFMVVVDSVRIRFK